MIRLYKRGRQYYDEEGARYDPMAVKYDRYNRFEIVDENKKRLPLRAPVVKSTRMAGDAIPEGLDELINEIRGGSQEQRLQADAQAYLLDRYDTLESMGVSRDDAALFDGLGHLPSSTSAPREIRTQIRPGVEERRHTVYDKEVNEMTGQRDINPYIDPVTKQPMVTQLGKVGQGLTRNDIDGYGEATEYIQQQIGRLAGMPLVRNNDNNVHAPDFKMNGKLIDGETTRPAWNDPAIQIYTKVMHEDLPNSVSKYRMAGAVEDEIRALIKANPEASITDVVNMSKNLYGGDSNKYGRLDPLLGKLYDDKSGIIVTKLPNKRHIANKEVDVDAGPVMSAIYQDIDTAQSVIEGYSGSELDKGLQVRPNDGHRKSYNRDPRGRVYVQPTSNDAKIMNKDMRKLSPLVEQLFDY